VEKRVLEGLADLLRLHPAISLTPASLFWEHLQNARA